MKITKMELNYQYYDRESISHYSIREYVVDWDNGDKEKVVINRDLSADPKYFTATRYDINNPRLLSPDQSLVINGGYAWGDGLSWNKALALVKTTLENSTSIL